MHDRQRNIGQVYRLRQVMLHRHRKERGKRYVLEVQGHF